MEDLEAVVEVEVVVVWEDLYQEAVQEVEEDVMILEDLSFDFSIFYKDLFSNLYTDKKYSNVNNDLNITIEIKRIVFFVKNNPCFCCCCFKT